MALVERAAALDSLLEYAERARGGEGCLVLVPGEAGVGKSALVEALAGLLPEARWSWGLCDGLSTPRPLLPLFDVAAALGGELGELSRARRRGRSRLSRSRPSTTTCRRCWPSSARPTGLWRPPRPGGWARSRQMGSPSAEAAATVHREAHGLVADEIYQVQEGS